MTSQTWEEGGIPTWLNGLLAQNRYEGEALNASPRERRGALPKTADIHEKLSGRGKRGVDKPVQQQQYSEREEEEYRDANT